MKNNKLYLISALILANLSHAQIGINETTIHPEVLQSGSTDKVWITPLVTSISNVANPAEGMIVYDESKGGLMGYQKHPTNTLHWSDLLLTGKIIIPTTFKDTLPSYYRNMSVYNISTEYIITDLTNTINVDYGGQELIVKLESDIAFSTACFRGILGIRLINEATNSVVTQSSRLFNYGGVSGTNSVIPFQLTLTAIAPTAGSYKIEIYHNPSISTVCTTNGYFTNNVVSIIHH